MIVVEPHAFDQMQGKKTGIDPREQLATRDSCIPYHSSKFSTTDTQPKPPYIIFKINTTYHFTRSQPPANMVSGVSLNSICTSCLTLPRAWPLVRTLIDIPLVRQHWPQSGVHCRQLSWPSIHHDCERSTRSRYSMGMCEVHDPHQPDPSVQALRVHDMRVVL
jgi:hypothetical protein